ncbi:Protein kinase domain [Dillenia turbinata]|uniref:Protein kinase domain n=1 Tax=Dillenia turbinata TaxID=194707 RepID=A0AAN8V1C2_9MAGN
MAHKGKDKSQSEHPDEEPLIRRINADEIPPEVMPLGSGNYSTVYTGIFEGKSIAVKRCKNNNHFDAEYRFFQQVGRHRNIIELIAYCRTENVFILEKGQCSLMEKMKELTWKLTRRALKHIAKALIHIHAKGFVYMDLKPENAVLVLNEKRKKGKKREQEEEDGGQKMDTKLVDFGATTRKGSFANFRTKNYSDPKQRVACSTKDDVYSFGVVLLQLLKKCDENGVIDVIHEAKTNQTFVIDGDLKTSMDENVNGSSSRRQQQQNQDVKRSSSALLE